MYMYLIVAFPKYGVSNTCILVLNLFLVRRGSVKAFCTKCKETDARQLQIQYFISLTIFI